MGETIARLLPVRALSRVDLPTLGRPMMATAVSVLLVGAVGAMQGSPPGPEASPYFVVDFGTTCGSDVAVDDSFGRLARRFPGRRR